MELLKIGTVRLPKVYLCNRQEAQECRSHGVPYIIVPDGWSTDKVIKAILYNTLRTRFPHINWLEMFGFSFAKRNELIVHHCPESETEVVKPDARVYCGSGGTTGDLTMTEGDEYRPTAGGSESCASEEFHYENSSIDDYIGDAGWCVSIEDLQSLRILPTFMDDIANAIKVNLMNTMYMDGYNKKLECNMGSWQGSQQAPNLIILDVSGSIPSGVAGTMTTLIDTLRTQANADLIITSWTSVYFPANSELPTPDELSSYIGGCNECVAFNHLLREHVLGKHWGNVIVFGDFDAPDAHRFRDYERYWLKDSELQATRIDNIMAFHTYWEAVPGYGLWATKAYPKPNIEINCDWVKYMRRD